MHLKITIVLCFACVFSSAAQADETLQRILADWKAIRDIDDVYSFEYEFKRQSFSPRMKYKLHDMNGEFVIDWKNLNYRSMVRTKSLRKSEPVMFLEVFDGQMRSQTTWPIEIDGTVGKSPIEARTSKGDFTATQFDQDQFPFLVAKRVVVTRPRETYRPGKMRFAPDEALLYIHKRQGPIVTLNTFPKSAGPTRSYWQYDVDLDKQSAITAMRSMQQIDGKPDAIHVEWSIAYHQVEKDWVITGWVDRQYLTDSGKLLNRYDMKVTRFEKSQTSPEFHHEIPHGQKVKSVTYPEFNPSDKEHQIVEITEYRDPERTRSRSYLAIAGAILGIVAIAFLLRRRFRKTCRS